MATWVSLMLLCLSPQNLWSPVRTTQVYCCVRLQHYYGLWFCCCGRSLLKTARQHDTLTNSNIVILSCTCTHTIRTCVFYLHYFRNPNGMFSFYCHENYTDFIRSFNKLTVIEHLQCNVVVWMKYLVLKCTYRGRKLWLTRDHDRNKAFSDPHHWFQSGLSGIFPLLSDIQTLNRNSHFMLCFIISWQT